MIQLTDDLFLSTLETKWSAKNGEHGEQYAYIVDKHEFPIENQAVWMKGFAIAEKRGLITISRANPHDISTNKFLTLLGKAMMRLTQ